MAGKKKMSERALLQKDLAEQPAYIEKLRDRVDQANAKIMDLMNENEALKNELNKLADRQNILETVEANLPKHDFEALVKELAESGRKLKIVSGAGDVIKIKPYMDKDNKPSMQVSVFVDGQLYNRFQGKIILVGKEKAQEE